MRELEAYRAAIRRQALLHAGIDPNLRRTFTAQTEMLGTEASLLRLPVSALSALQDPDTGALHFLWGASTWGTDAFTG